MRTLWRKETASDSNSIWFVGIEADRISVLAPPGVPVTRHAETDLNQQRLTGWSWGVWDRDCADHWPVIDHEPPLGVREITTLDALDLLGEELQELVWNCLWQQLQVARQIGCQREDTIPSEDLARAGAVAVAWLTAELTSAFPDRSDLLKSYVQSVRLELSDPPNDPAELTRPLCVQQNELLALHTEARAKRFSIRAFAWRFFVKRRDDRMVERHPDRRAGEPLDGCRCSYGTEPGDRSSYGWGNTAVGTVDSATEELAHL
jgi:hypothetical protein